MNNERKFSVIIYLNRFIALISEYGYTILVNLYLSHISVIFVTYFWIIKLVASFVTTRIKKYIIHIDVKNTLILFEIVKVICLICLAFTASNITILSLVFVIELVNVFFNSQLYAIVPDIISKQNLVKFNSVYTSIGALSYFVAPLIVGAFIGKSNNILFIIYSFFIFLGTILLFMLPTLTNQSNSKKRKISVSKKIFDTKNISIVIVMLVWSTLLGSIGVLFDTYEIIFMVQYLGISEKSYSFSLSFLAMLFLFASFLFSYVKSIRRHFFVFVCSVIGYTAYLIIFSFAYNLNSILWSYFFLAISQTTMGIVENNYVQLKLDKNDLQAYYIFSEVLNCVVPGILVMLVGVLSIMKISVKLFIIFRFFAIVSVLFSLIFIFFNKEKLFENINSEF